MSSTGAPEPAGGPGAAGAPAAARTSALVHLSLGRPVTVLMAVLSVLVLGGISFTRLPLDFLPQVSFPFIGVLVPYENAIPAQVETEIARPLEEVFATLGDVQHIRSESTADHCFVGVEFKWGREVDLLRLEVKEKVDQIRSQLPADVRDLYLFTFNSSDIPVMEGRISAHGKDLSQSYELIQHRILRRIERIDGVGRVELDGVAPDQVAVYLHIDRLKQYRVDVRRLFARLRSANLNLSVGRLTDGGLRYTARTVGAIHSAAELRNLRIDETGLRLGDIATVMQDVPALTSGRFLNGEPAVAFEVQKTSNSNAVEVCRRIRAEIEEIRRDPALQGIEVIFFFDQGREITRSLGDLLGSGVQGSLLAMGILYFFLRRVATTLIVSIAIPFSVIATAIFLYLAGKNLNVLSMMGLMLAVGMLVDNAIVVLEAIHRHEEQGEAPGRAAAAGASEVAMAVAASTLTSVCVFAPVIFGGKNELMVWLSEVGITLSVTLIFSLVISLTLIPLMCARLRAARAVPESRFLCWVADAYARVLEWTAIRHPWRTLLLLGAVVVATGVAGGLAGFKIDPDTDRGMRREQLEVNFEFTDNMNYVATREVVRGVEAKLLAAKQELGVESVYSRYSDNSARAILFFRDTPLSEKRVRELRERLRKLLPDPPGARLRLGGEEAAGLGAKRLEVTLFGEDSDLLGEYAREVKRRLALLPGLEDVSTDIEGGTEEVAVSVRRAAARQVGVTPREVAELLGLTFRGVELPPFRAGDREVPVQIALERSDRRNLEDLQSLPVAMEGGAEVTLGQIARFDLRRGPHTIKRLSQRTAVTVYGNYEGEDFGDLKRRVEALMDTIAMPPGYRWSFGEDIEESEEQGQEMLVNILLAIVCVYLVMASLFESLLHPLVIMITIPFAFLGVVWTMVLTRTPMNIMALIGVVILIGVVVNNGIILIDHVNTFRRRGLTRADAILAGGRERLRPILMTALTTVLGLIPLSVGHASIGDAQYYPMARAVMGGLLVSTALTLVVLPTFYVLAEKTAHGLGRAGARAAAAVGRRV